MSKEKRIIISEAGLAETLKITERRVREVCKNSRTAPGRYDFRNSVMDFIEQSNNKDKDFVTAKRLSEILEITDKSVRELVDRNILSRENDNNYDLISNVKAYINYIRSSDRNTAHKTAQTNLLIQTYQVRSKELHLADDIKKYVGKMIVNFKQKLLTIPKREGKNFLGIKDRFVAEEKLEELINGALEELSEYNPSEEQNGTENIRPYE